MLHDHPSEWISVHLELPRVVVEAAILEARRQAADAAHDRQALARSILRGRRRRSGCLPAVEFGEPCWDMILELYASSSSEPPFDVTSLCAAAGVPKTTALRHLDRLIGRGVIARSEDGSDNRRHVLQLTDTSLVQIERWLDVELGMRARAIG